MEHSRSFLLAGLLCLSASVAVQGLCKACSDAFAPRPNMGAPQVKYIAGGPGLVRIGGGGRKCEA